MIGFVQMLEDLRGLLQVADEKLQASLAELSLKHQKVKLVQMHSSKPFVIHEGFFLLILLHRASY